MELDDVSAGGGEMAVLSPQRPSHPGFWTQVERERTPVAGTSVSGLLFPLAASRLDFLEPVPGLSPRPGSVKHHPWAHIKQQVQG